ncbi:MAG: hypothetical protein ACKO6N_19210 [Myxococcota bacterium]
MSTQSELQSVQSATFFEGGAPVLLQQALKLMEQERPLIVLTRSLPSAVFVRESLCPTRYLNDQGLPSLDRNVGPVALFRAREQAGGRRALVAGLIRGERKVLVLTPEDLLRPGSLETLASTHATWLVQDAQCVCVESLEFVAGYGMLLQGWQQGLLNDVRLFSAQLPPVVGQVLQQLFRLDSIPVTSSVLPENVEVRFQEGPASLRERSALTQLLQQHVRESGVKRGVWVLPSRGVQSLPFEELISIANEVGLPAVSDPGEDVAVPAERHAELFHGPASLLLTSDPAALSGRPDGEPLLCLHLQAPRGLEGVRSEVAELAARGGGRWVYAPVGAVSAGLSVVQLEALARWILAQLPAGASRLVVDAEGLLQSVLDASAWPLDVFAQALEQALGLLWGAGFLSHAQRVRVLLKVAESHRFASPHIDVDPRYATLKTRYDEALSRLGLMQAVRLRLSAQPAKDLRELSAVLGYSVAELNVLFEDLERDDFLLCRLEEGGARTGNRSFELELQGDVDTLASRLEQALERLALRQTHEQQAQVLLAELVAGAVTWPQVLEQLPVMTESAGVRSVTAWSMSPPSGTKASISPSAVSAMPVLSEPDVERVGTPPVEAKVNASAGAAPVMQRSAQAFEWQGSLTEPAVFQALYAQVERASTRMVQSWQPSGEDVSACVARIMRALVLGELTEATELLLAALSHGEALQPVLSRLLLMLDFEGALLGGEMPRATTSLLLLPTLEGVDAATLRARLSLAGFAGQVMVADDASVRITDGEQRFKLVRRLLDPELEARIWLALSQRSSPLLPAGVVQARLSESYLMNEGQGDASLELALRQQLLDGSMEASWGQTSRRALALGRAQLRAGQWEATLEHVQGFLGQPGGSADLSLTAAEAWLMGEQALRALETLQAAGLSAQRGRAQGLYQNVVRVLQRQCEGQASCDGCPLLGSAFCPVPELFEGFISANPLGEGRKFLRQRVDKRAGHGFAPSDPKQLLSMLNSGGLTDENRALGWMEPMQGGAASSWLELARGLAQAQLLKAAVLALKKAVSLGAGQALLLSGCARGLLALGEQAESFAAAQEADAAGWSVPERQAYLQALQERGVKEDPSLPEWVVGLLAHAAQAKRLQQSREQLQRSLRHPQLRELRSRMEVLEGLLGEQAGQDPLLREGQERLKEREQRLSRRLEQILKGPAAPPIAQELEQLTREAEALGFSELHGQLAATTIRMKSALERRSQERKPRDEKPQPVTQREGQESAGSSTDVATSAPVPASISTPSPAEPKRGNEDAARRGRGERREESRPEKREDGRGERRGEQAPRAERASTGPAPGPEVRGGRRLDHSREPGRGRHEDMQRSGRERAPAPPPVLEGQALLDAVQKAEQDRERTPLVMAAFSAGLATDVEKSIKLLRDTLPFFERSGALDAGLSRLIREKKINNEHFPRLRRVLDKAHGGANLNATYEELNRQEHPEAWKLVLGQLKIK